tara:strand:+ start:428 stop:748 length:321 start_codon:yes stop_codon:yes gene_type:complete
MNKTLYFTITNDPADAAGDAIMMNADTFLGAIPATATTTELYFNKINGTADLSKFTVTHANGDCQTFMKAFGDLVSTSPKDGFVIVHDKVSGEGINLITSVAFTTL